MSQSRVESPASAFELIVLARLSSKSAPKSSALESSLRPYAPDGTAEISTLISRSLESLQRRGLATGKHVRTAAGEAELRALLGVKQVPDWRALSGRHLLMKALGRPALNDPKQAVPDATQLAILLLASHYKLSDKATPTDLGNAIIAEMLGMPPGAYALAEIRAFAIARRFDVAVANPDNPLPQIAAAVLKVEAADKKTMAPIIIRGWLYNAKRSSLSPAPTPPPPPPLRLAFGEDQPKASPASSAQPPMPPASQPKPSPPKPVPPPTPAEMLSLVRSAIPHVPAEGRHGKEKVFVSALWDRVTQATKLPDYSIDHFKRWLIDAQRERWLDLARADLQSSMDPKLLAASEIRDLGAVFHFVVDLKPTANGRGSHAR